jgi:hypothetical protein
LQKKLNSNNSLSNNSIKVGNIDPMIREYQDPNLVKIDEAQQQSEDSSNRQRGKKQKSKDRKVDNKNEKSKQ